MMKRKTLYYVLFLLLGATNLIFATDYYVDGKIGSDANTGKSSSSPWKTIQKAANIMIGGDICYVSPANYPERITIKNSGSASARIVFKALNSGTITKGFTITANYITVDGFEVTETSRTDWTAGTGFHIVGQYVDILNNYIHITYREGIRLGVDPSSSATSNCQIKGNKIIRCGQSGILLNGQNNLFENNEISGIVQWSVTNPQGLDAVGMRFFGSGHIIRKNYIHDILMSDPENGSDPHVDAFQTWGPATNITFEQNTFSMGEPTVNKQICMIDETAPPVNDIIIRNNVFYSTLRGLNIYGTVYASTASPIERVTITNNTFADFKDNPIELHDCPNAIVKNNIFYNTVQIYIDSKTFSSGLQIGYNSFYNNNGTQAVGTNSTGDILNSDPKFVNPSARDYHLAQGSPMIDKGTSVTGLTVDRDGTSRPQGSAIDIGAYEYKTTTTTVPPTQDVTPPALLSAVSQSATSIKLTFSEKINASDAQLKSNYNVNNGLKVKNAVLSSTGDAVVLTTSYQKSGKTYTVTANNIRDLAGNIISSTAKTASFTTAASSWNQSLYKNGANGMEEIPDNYELGQNYPNPFNPSTVINFSIVHFSNVSLKVYDILGKEVATLINNQMSPGNYSIEFNASNLASGTYIYQLKTNNFVQNRKMVITK